MQCHTTKLKLKSLRTEGTQARAGLNPETVADYADLYRAGKDLPAVIVFQDGIEYWLADGHHRAAGARQAGREEILAEIHQGTQRDAIQHACGANKYHGLRRTNEDKRRAVELMLRDQEWMHWTDHRIADHCGVSQPFVSKLRAELAPGDNGYQLPPAGQVPVDDTSPPSCNGSQLATGTQTTERINRKGKKCKVRPKSNKEKLGQGSNGAPASPSTGPNSAPGSTPAEPSVASNTEGDNGDMVKEQDRPSPTTPKSPPTNVADPGHQEPAAAQPNPDEADQPNQALSTPRSKNFYWPKLELGFLIKALDDFSEKLKGYRDAEGPVRDWNKVKQLLSSIRPTLDNRVGRVLACCPSGVSMQQGATDGQQSKEAVGQR